MLIILLWHLLFIDNSLLVILIPHCLHGFTHSVADLKLLHRLLVHSLKLIAESSGREFLLHKVKRLASFDLSM